MKESLQKALAETTDASTDRILAAAFFRPRPLQAGSVAEVVSLAERRSAPPRR